LVEVTRGGVQHGSAAGELGSGGHDLRGPARMKLGGYNWDMARIRNKTRATTEEQELALKLEEELTAEDRVLLRETEALIDEHSELFELLAEE
jgi:hypothetical protein